MPRKAANDNHQRPAEFDAQIAAAYPRLLARAKRFSSDPEALAGQAMVFAMERWRNFRQTPGRPYAGFFTWLSWCMASTASDYKDKSKVLTILVSYDAVKNPPEIRVDGAQEASADLKAVLNALSPRERDVILRRASGETSKEICADYGVTRQRIDQIEGEARAKVIALAANDNGKRAA